MNRFYRKSLLDEISNKHRSLNEIRKQYKIAVDDLNGRLTYFKQYALKIAINRAVHKNENIIMKRHLKKFNALLHERNKRDGLTSNPNRIITNLSSHILSNDEYNVLQYGLKHGISTSPKSSTVLAYSEDIWDQIRRSNIHSNSEYTKMKIKNALRSFAFNLIDIDDKNIFKDATKLKIIKNLRKTLVIMKPGKGNGIFLLNKDDYTRSMEHLFW